MTAPGSDVRREAAGALLITHMTKCIAAMARDDAAALPDMDIDPWQDEDDLERAVMTITAMLGHNPDNARARMKVCRMFQALAELICVQGAQLECDFANVIFDQYKHLIVMSVAEDDA